MFRNSFIFGKTTNMYYHTHAHSARDLSHVFVWSSCAGRAQIAAQVGTFFKPVLQKCNNVYRQHTMDFAFVFISVYWYVAYMVLLNSCYCVHFYSRTCFDILDSCKHFNFEDRSCTTCLGRSDFSSQWNMAGLLLPPFTQFLR